MLKTIIFFWGHPSPFRTAASLAVGVTLGICFAGSPVWLVILILCLILRTHILSLLVGLITGNILKIILNNSFEPAGKAILLYNEIFWQKILSKPVICYLNLNVGKVMGNLFVAIVCGLIIFILLFPILKNIHNIMFPKLKTRKPI